MTGRRRVLRSLGLGSIAGITAMLRPAIAGVVELDRPAPALRGRRFDGEPFDLRAWRGFVVLVNFYSSYCSICAREIGNIQAVSERLGPSGLKVIMVSIDAPDDLDRTRRFVDNYQLPGLLADSADEIGFEKRYPTPTCYVVDRDGVVRDKRVGAKTGAFYRESVVPLLKGISPEY